MKVTWALLGVIFLISFFTAGLFGAFALTALAAGAAGTAKYSGTSGELGVGKRKKSLY